MSELPRGVATTRDAAKFGAAVALLGIFWDAAVGHGLTWENDPYWTYWVTKTFLIATVFGLGTAWVGVGLGRGAAITAVHTLALTVYYWTFSPIGLPSHPSWLDLEHTWITGVPIHFAVIYLGYLNTLWLWRRRGALAPGDARRDAVVVVAAAVAVVAVAGGAATLALFDWPGVTYYLVRLLITVPFLLLWWSLVGSDWAASLAGAVTLAFVWATYGEYLGPVGIPDTPLRILDDEPPPAHSGWLDFREQWLISLPIYVVATAAVVLAAAPFLSANARRGTRVRVPIPAVAAVLALVAGPPAVANVWVDSGGENADLSASGAADVEQGGWFSDRTARGEGTLTLEAEDHIRKVTPLPPHDELLVSATVRHPNGRTYEISVDKPMVEDPAGRHGTWWGVGIDVWHHGKSGIGSDQIPATRSEVAVFGLGEVEEGGRTLARNVPVHVMTGHGDDDDPLELDVGDPAALVPGLPDGHLRVVWPTHTGGADRSAEWARYVFGGLVLLSLLALALVANLRAVPSASQGDSRSS